MVSPCKPGGTGGEPARPTTEGRPGASGLLRAGVRGSKQIRNNSAAGQLSGLTSRLQPAQQRACKEMREQGQGYSERHIFRCFSLPAAPPQSPPAPPPARPPASSPPRSSLRRSIALPRSRLCHICPAQATRKGRLLSDLFACKPRPVHNGSRGQQGHGAPQATPPCPALPHPAPAAPPAPSAHPPPTRSPAGPAPVQTPARRRWWSSAVQGWPPDPPDPPAGPRLQGEGAPGGSRGQGGSRKGSRASPAAAAGASTCSGEQPQESHAAPAPHPAPALLSCCCHAAAKGTPVASAMPSLVMLASLCGPVQG